MANAEPTKCKLEVIDSPVRTKGMIHLRGKVRLATWRRPSSEEPQQYYVGHHCTLGLDDPQYHQQFIPLSKYPTKGPEAYALYGNGEKQIGYFVPDTDKTLPALGVDGETGIDLSDLSLVHQIFCFQIFANPHDGQTNDFAVPWAAKGLALIRLESHVNLYRRVGYIELSRENPRMEF